MEMSFGDSSLILPFSGTHRGRILVPTTNPPNETKSTNLEMRFTLTETPERGVLSIYLTDLYRGVIIPIFRHQSIGGLVDTYQFCQPLPDCVGRRNTPRSRKRLRMSYPQSRLVFLFHTVEYETFAKSQLDYCRTSGGANLVT